MCAANTASRAAILDTSASTPAEPGVPARPGAIFQIGVFFRNLQLNNLQIFAEYRQYILF